MGHFPAKPVMLRGSDPVIRIPALGLALPLAEIYRGIGAGLSDGQV